MMVVFPTQNPVFATITNLLCQMGPYLLQKYLIIFV